jgi:DnaJ-class molecular chaperone
MWIDHTQPPEPEPMPCPYCGGRGVVAVGYDALTGTPTTCQCVHCDGTGVRE